MVQFETYKIKEKENEASFCPKRGGIITSLKFEGKEVFYFDRNTFEDEGQSVRGGIPILFPNAGELKENNIFPKLSRHGFARNMEWNFEQGNNYFNESLTSSDKTKLVYPYNFNLKITGRFIDGYFNLTQEIENIGNVDMPISSGLHPYFYVPNNEKENIIFDFPGGEYIKDNFETWSNGGTLYLDNPNVPLKIFIPSIGELFIKISKEYKKIWVWSLPDKDFICIEPMMGEVNGLIDKPTIIKPSQNLISSIEISLSQPF